MTKSLICIVHIKRLLSNKQLILDWIKLYNRPIEILVNTYGVYGVCICHFVLLSFYIIIP